MPRITKSLDPKATILNGPDAQTHREMGKRPPKRHSTPLTVTQWFRSEKRRLKLKGIETTVQPEGKYLALFTI